MSQYSLLLHVSHFLATLERFCAFFKLPDFILSVQLLQLPKSTVLKKKEKNRTSALLYHFQEGTSCRRKFGPLKNPHRLASALPFETILSFFSSFLFFFFFLLFLQPSDDQCCISLGKIYARLVKS